MTKRKNLTGRIFGDLQVISYNKTYLGRAFWLCRCSCGKEKIFSSTHLLSGHSTSCGCKKSEKISKAQSKINQYGTIDIETMVCFCSNGLSFIFDKEDYDKIKNYCWVIPENVKYKYAQANNKNKSIFGNKDLIKFHKFIMNILNNNDILIDHIDGNTLNNRKSNLRLVNKSQNMMNSKNERNNSSGRKGVSWSKILNKWLPKITINGIEIILTSHENLEDAIHEREIAEEKYFGEYRRK